MIVFKAMFERPTTPDTDIHDLTRDVSSVVAESGVQQGQVLVFTPGSTAAITTIEFESGAVAALRRALNELAPPGADDAHALPDENVERDAAQGVDLLGGGTLAAQHVAYERPVRPDGVGHLGVHATQGDVGHPVLP